METEEIKYEYRENPLKQNEILNNEVQKSDEFFQDKDYHDINEGNHNKIYHVCLYLTSTIYKTFIGFDFSTCISLCDLGSHGLENIEGKWHDGVFQLWGNSIDSIECYSECPVNH